MKVNDFLTLEFLNDFLIQEILIEILTFRVKSNLGYNLKFDFDGEGDNYRSNRDGWKRGNA